MTKRFKKIYIEITNICNLSCTFCKKDNRKKQMINIRDFEKILKSINDYTDYIYLHIKGEPLLHKKLDKILNLCSKYNKHVNITTNGTILTEKLDIILSSNSIRQINISLHSINKDVDNYLNDIYYFIDEILNKTNIIISLRMWIDNQELLTIIKNKFNISESLNEKNSFKITERLYLNQDKEFVWPDLNNEYYNEFGTCLGLKDQIGILVDGTVVPCCLDDEGIINLGNIYNNTLDNIIKSDRVKNIIEGFNNNKKEEELCKHCNFKRNQ